MSSLRVIFAGTPDFAAISLTALIKSQHQIVAVYTQPDRPAGRGRKLHASAVKEVAVEHHIPVFQPEKLNNAATLDILRGFEADVMVVAAYGLILPKRVLEIPRFGCINIHASLLPRWRGAAPIQRAIAAGDKESGITIMQMNAGLDTGDILHTASYPIANQDTGGDLHDRLAELGAEAILKTLEKLNDSSLKPIAQNNSLASYAHKLNKKDAIIHWQNSASEIERLIRAFNPWPVAFSYLQNKPLRIWRAQALTQQSDRPIGTVVKCDKHGIDISCGNGMLRLLKLQTAGSKAMDVAAFMNGHAKQLPVGSVFQSSQSK